MTRDEMQQHDETTVAPEVLVTVARLSASGTNGVARLVNPPPAAGLFRRGIGEGVIVKADDGEVEVDVYLIARGGFNVLKVSREVQSRVARAMEEMVGLSVIKVDVHIENVEYDDEKSAA